MANHPYNMHREQQVAHRRVDTILKGSPAGATKHAQGNAFSKVTSKSAASSHDDIAGSKSAPGRFARGGKVKSKGGTNVNIIIPGGGAGAPKPPMPPMGAPPPMPGPPMPPPPMGGPPGMPPGGPPGMPPMRASGGRIKKAEGGAGSGVGRLDKEADAKKRK